MIVDGRSYVSDGWCYLMDYLVCDIIKELIVKVGEEGSELILDELCEFEFKFFVLVLLEGILEVFVELIVNGYLIEIKEIIVDGG